jgi:hypothetical protein
MNKNRIDPLPEILTSEDALLTGEFLRNGYFRHHLQENSDEKKNLFEKFDKMETT